MLSLRSRNNSTTSRENKELQKLKRQDILELLIEQMQENDALRASISEAETQIRELTSLSERLKDKLNDKDAQIELLKDRLNDKDAQIDSFKARLDDKDALLEHLYEQARTMVGENREQLRMAAMLAVEDLMASHYMHRAGQQEADEESEVVAEDEALVEEAPEEKVPAAEAEVVAEEEAHEDEAVEEEAPVDESEPEAAPEDEPAEEAAAEDEEPEVEPELEATEDAEPAEEEPSDEE